MKNPILRANKECDGSVYFPPEFKELDILSRADLLQDWILSLEEEYKATLDEGWGIKGSWRLILREAQK